MSRLYLIIILLISPAIYGQNNLKKYLDFAKEQFDKGDYYYALEYYEKAMELDSQTIDILWNYAETLRAYKDYRKAEFYYAKVYDREEAKIYPSSLLQLGLMQKQNGKYDEALTTFKKAKKKYYKDKKGYLYQKSKREIQSTLWAKSAMVDSLGVSVEQLPETVNTKNSEFGHGIVNGELIFSSLRADSISALEEVYSTTYHTHLYRSKVKEGELDFEASEKIKDLFIEAYNTGNGAFSLDGNRFYFSKCADDGYNYRCKIMVARYSNKQWVTIDSLGDIINEPGSNTTMPCIAEINGNETLIFASDREESEGGLDLFYSRIRNSNQYSKVRALRMLNSPDNEISPWWDSINQRLYFSSSWHDGFGGYDVFYSQYDRQFQQPENVGQPINSPANDLYYFKYVDTSFVTTNRIGVFYSKNPTCCSDIFMFKPPVKIIPPTSKETLFELNKRLPVTLYFHNDRPNPDSWKTSTELNYMTTYDRYTAMLDEYKTEYSKGLKGEKADEAREDIETFFLEYVDKGVADLEHFRDLLFEELEKGVKVEVTVKGFASPLAKTEYNVNLTKRRISSLENYLREYDDGIFAPYLDGTASNGGRVIIKQTPFGEYTANQLTSDNPNDVQNSVYSRAAAIERKIEIQSVNYLEENEKFPLKCEIPVIDGGQVKPGRKISVRYKVMNRSDVPIRLTEPKRSSQNFEVEINASEIAPGQVVEIKVDLDTNGFMGHSMEYISLGCEDCSGELELYLTFEIKE
jgi:tetratricopeptide (TPR) repeat protein